MRQTGFMGTSPERGQLKIRGSVGRTLARVSLAIIALGSALGEKKESPVTAGRRSAPAQRDYTISVDVSLVLVPAVVTDRAGRTVLGLGRENFRLLEDGEPREIASLSTEDIPTSVGLVFDVSGSMKNKMATARAAAHVFMETANPEDEFFLVTFADRPFIEVDMTPDPRRIDSGLFFSKPGSNRPYRRGVPGSEPLAKRPESPQDGGCGLGRRR